MPARSEAQRRFIFGNKGEAFARKHHFDNPGKLPKKAPKRRGRKPTRDEINREELIRAFRKKGKHGRAKR